MTAPPDDLVRVVQKAQDRYSIRPQQGETYWLVMDLESGETVRGMSTCGQASVECDRLNAIAAIEAVRVWDAQQSKPTDGLTIVADDKRLTISIGVDALAQAIRHADGWPDETAVSDAAVFANAVYQELMVEDEDGSTLVHRMLDRAAVLALESGCEGVGP